MSNDFTQLLADLDALQELRKAHPEPDGDEVDGKEPEDNPDESEVGSAEDDEQIEEAAEEEPMKKSLLLSSGEEIEFLDGTELIKSLTDRVDNQDEALTKILQSTTEIVKSMQAEIDGLKESVQKLSASGRGRKTVLSVTDPAAPAGVSPQEFMAKAMDAQKAGRLTALQVSVAEGYLQRGLDIPAPIKNLVFEG